MGVQNFVGAKVLFASEWTNYNSIELYFQAIEKFIKQIIILETNIKIDYDKRTPSSFFKHGIIVLLENNQKKIPFFKKISNKYKDLLHNYQDHYIGYRYGLYNHSYNSKFIWDIDNLILELFNHINYLSGNNTNNFRIKFSVPKMFKEYFLYDSQIIKEKDINLVHSFYDKNKEESYSEILPLINWIKKDQNRIMILKYLLNNTEITTNKGLNFKDLTKNTITDKKSIYYNIKNMKNKRIITNSKKNMILTPKGIKISKYLYFR